MSKTLFVLLPLHFGMSEESMYDIACLVVNNLICEITWLKKNLNFSLPSRQATLELYLTRARLRRILLLLVYVNSTKCCRREGECKKYQCRAVLFPYRTQDHQ